MIFHETNLPGAFRIEPKWLEDERGFFARTWCAREAEARGLNPRLVQCSLSYSRHRGTLRGMHYQAAPHQEAKLIRCTRGAMYDVIVDLRPRSPTFKRWFGAELTAENQQMLYVPEDFAHGFLTLADDTETHYQMSAFFNSESARGICWNDPALAIRWPDEPRVISERDQQYPDFHSTAMRGDS